ncbi:hypothetical protein [Pseudomonas phage PASB7]|uniref:Uncharacterized protein n=1 Tax=Pseudomonas phage vB_PaeP_DEV TaxID=2034344 RepID=A0A2K8I3G0_9CAUD|nr:hypothetical protein vBPaePPYO2_00025 [Pseudomonas phage vB_PaeP_PYO2]ASZ72232.1 hypothetical protein vBPaePDEV_00025 [Pseudomonas phage vB_PaeP_DEV]UNY40730.1 hypothetical protein [Pseudomonas phage CMS1]UYE96436.1 hypothetical protein [Pseudomonas phage vB_PaeP_4029]WNV46211.1 hypothetical protein [Pseudomonas phage PASB7]
MRKSYLKFLDTMAWIAAVLVFVVVAVAALTVYNGLVALLVMLGAAVGIGMTFGFWFLGYGIYEELQKLNAHVGS